MRTGLVISACALTACSFHVSGAAPGQTAPLDLAAPLDSAASLDLAVSAPDFTVVNDLATRLDLANNAHLTVTSAGTISPVNLTTVGTADWEHWGFAQPTDVDRKTTGTALSALTVTGTGGVLKQFMPFPTQYQWNDGGNGNGSHPNSPGNAGCVYTNGGGLSITAPAGLASRTLIIYVSYINTQARMQIALSDGSAAAHDDSANTNNDSLLHDVAYTADYAAASDNQQLTITWSLATPNPGTNGLPAVALCAAALTPPVTPAD